MRISKNKFVEIKNTLQYPYNLMSKKSKKRFFKFCYLQITINILDFLAVALIALIIYAIRNYLNNEEIIFEIFSKQIKTKSTTNLMGIMVFTLIFSCFLFITKTILSLVVLKKTIDFLSQEGTQITEKVMNAYAWKTTAEKNSTEVGKLVYASTEGVNRITIGVLGSFTILISDAFLLLLISFVLFLVDPILTLISIFLIVICGFFLYTSIARKIFFAGETKSSTDIEMSAMIQTFVFNFREIYVKNEINSFVYRIKEIRRRNSTSIAGLWFYPNISKYIIETGVILGAVILGGIIFWWKGIEIALSTLAIFLVAGTRIAPSIIKIQQNLLLIKGSSGQALQTIDLLLSAGNNEDIQEEHFFSDYAKKGVLIDFEKVSFQYHKSSEDSLLQEIDFELPKTGLVLIGGKSGSGKSTIIDLMLGIILPTSGKVRINGKPVKHALNEKENLISYIPQNSPLLSTTIKENIVFPSLTRKIDEKQIRNCLNTVGLWEVIEELEDSYNTHVGILGSNLSGGQRQRLAIARAIYADPEILIVDEGTSGLDEEAEQEIFELLKTLSEKILVVIVSHSSYAKKYADIYLELINGKITK